MTTASEDEDLRTLAAQALAAYDLPPHRAEPLRLLNNAVFCVEVRAAAGWQPAYALRLHRPDFREPGHTRSELSFMHALAAEGRVTVPDPIPTRAGDLIVPLVGATGDTPAHASLLRWLPGTVRRPGSGLGPHAAARLGEALGYLHDFAEGFLPPEGFALPTWDADGLLSEASPFRPGPLAAFLTPDERAAVERLRERVARLFADLTAETGPLRVIHGDFILGNCLWHGRGPRVLDWDDCGWGHFLYDMAPVLGNLRDFPSYRPLRAAFLAGYRRVRLLPEGWERHIPLLIATRHATSALWAAGLLRHAQTEEDVNEWREHIAYRMAEMHDCLAEAGAGEAQPRQTITASA